MLGRMAEFRDVVETILGNPTHELLLATGVGAALLAMLSTIIVASRRRLHSGREPQPHLLLDIAANTRIALMIFPVAWIAARALRIGPSAATTFMVLVDLSMIVQVAIWVGTLIDDLVGRQQRRIAADGSAITTLRAFRAAALVLVWTIAILTALATMGVAITPLVAGLGIGGVAVALAVQNILGDLFASLSIVVDKPFVVGDTIGVGEVTASVEHIGLKTTRLRSILGEQVIISNGELLKTWIHNYKRMEERTIVFRIRVTHYTPVDVLERVPGIMKTAVESTPNTAFDRAHFAAFGDGSYEFECRYTVRSRDYAAYMDAQQQVNLAIARSFEKYRIGLARPTTVLEKGPAQQRISPERSVS